MRNGSPLQHGNIFKKLFYRVPSLLSSIIFSLAGGSLSVDNGGVPIKGNISKRCLIDSVMALASS
jgi:hypothetical protein